MNRENPTEEDICKVLIAISKNSEKQISENSLFGW